MNELLGLLKGVAPTLAMAVAGPLGASAVTALASKFGVSDSVDAVAKAISGDPQAAQKIAEMELEHYPGMTEKALEDIIAEARSRWDLFDALVIHRVGPLKPLDQIVLVAVTSAHRGEAFAACEFIIDYLKTLAPFWKKEQTPSGARWVDARVSDDQAMKKWDKAH